MLGRIKNHFKSNSRNYSDYIIVGGLFACTALTEPRLRNYILTNFTVHLSTTIFQRHGWISEKSKIAWDEFSNFIPLFYSVSPNNSEFSNINNELRNSSYPWLAWVYKGFIYANNLAIIGLIDKFSKNFFDWWARKPIKNEFEALAIYARLLPSQILKYCIFDNFSRSPLVSFTALASNYASKTFLMERVYKRFTLTDTDILLSNFDVAAKAIENQVTNLSQAQKDIVLAKLKPAQIEIEKEIRVGNLTTMPDVINSLANKLCEARDKGRGKDRKAIKEFTISTLKNLPSKTHSHYALESLFNILNEAMLGGTFGAVNYYINNNSCKTLLEAFNNGSKTLSIPPQFINNLSETCSAACELIWPYAGNIARGTENFLKKHYFERIERMEHQYAGIPI